MAYKDEYEVARLHTKPELREALAREFGPDAQWQLLLHPPLLRALGMKKKVALGAWFRPVLRALAELPDAIRGYEDVKLDNVERFRKAVRAKLALQG